MSADTPSNVVSFPARKPQLPPGLTNALAGIAIQADKCGRDLSGCTMRYFPAGADDAVMVAYWPDGTLAAFAPNGGHELRRLREEAFA